MNEYKIILVKSLTYTTVLVPRLGKAYGFVFETNLMFLLYNSNCINTDAVGFDL